MPHQQIDHGQGRHREQRRRQPQLLAERHRGETDVEHVKGDQVLIGPRQVDHEGNDHGIDGDDGQRLPVRCGNADDALDEIEDQEADQPDPQEQPLLERSRLDAGRHQHHQD